MGLGHAKCRHGLYRLFNPSYKYAITFPSFFVTADRVLTSVALRWAYIGGPMHDPDTYTLCGPDASLLPLALPIGPSDKINATCIEQMVGVS